MLYIMSERVNGVRKSEEDRQVADIFVDNFTGKRTREFFESLGGTEEYRKRRDGVIYLKSISPDGDTVREVVFTPKPAA